MAPDKPRASIVGREFGVRVQVNGSLGLETSVTHSQCVPKPRALSTTPLLLIADRKRMVRGGVCRVGECRRDKCAGKSDAGEGGLECKAGHDVSPWGVCTFDVIVWGDRVRNGEYDQATATGMGQGLPVRGPNRQLVSHADHRAIWICFPSSSSSFLSISDAALCGAR